MTTRRITVSLRLDLATSTIQKSQFKHATKCYLLPFQLLNIHPLRERGPDAELENREGKAVLPIRPADPRRARWPSILNRSSTQPGAHLSGLAKVAVYTCFKQLPPSSPSRLHSVKSSAHPACRRSNSSRLCLSSSLTSFSCTCASRSGCSRS